MSVFRGTLPFPVLWIPLAVLWTTLAGCQTLMDAPSGQAETLSAEMIDVQIRPAFGKAKNIQVALETDMTLQDVVDESRIPFRNKQAHIVRVSPETGENHKLEGEFGSNRRISLHTDYAVQPGDRVVVTQDTTTSFDRVMRSMFGGG